MADSPPQLKDNGRPMSEVIRERVRKAGKRFFANDNIAAFVESDAEIEALLDEVTVGMEQVLRSLVIDTENDHNTRSTARRVAKMYVREVFGARLTKMPGLTAFPNVERINELIVLGPITARSACSHHLCPIMGKVWIGVMPQAESSLIGLSKFARLVDWIMNRPQIQEEAVKNLADVIEQEIKPAGLAVVMRAEHFCMQWRGVKDQSSMTSSVMRGEFLANDALRKEFLTLARIS